MPDKRILITTAIAYVNAKPHIGFALELLYADALARFYRSQGSDVRLLTGTDEHGQKIARSAEAKQMEPQAFVDEVSAEYRKLFDLFQLESYDFVRTSSPNHQAAAQELWRRAAESGDIQKSVYEGLYCVGCEEYKTEKDLVDGKCPEHLVEPEQVKEENYFFRLSRYADRLLAWYEANPDVVLPNYRLTEMKEIIKRGLEDISISRDRSKLSWGVPVPGDENQVMYVWFDALTNYISAVGFGADDEEFAQWWPARMHIVGKGINRFHSILWPAMLMAAGYSVDQLPQQIAVHGYITVEGKKMSKSLGNVIDPIELIEQYGVDPVRYFLLREIPFDSDGDFSFDRLHARYQADLANGLGNLVSRVTNMIEKYFDGVLQPHDHEQWRFEDLDEKIAENFSFMDFDSTLNLLWTEVIDRANSYIEDHKPWALAKTDQTQLKSVLEQLLYALAYIPDRLRPFMPLSADKIAQIVGAEKISKAEPLFPRLETEK